MNTPGKELETYLQQISSKQSTRLVPGYRSSQVATVLHQAEIRCIFYAPHYGWRHVEVTSSRTKLDFAFQMKAIVELHFPRAYKIRVVLDNLNTHNPAALSATFSPTEARRILERLEFHYTPKHGSWLNQVEIEISVLSRQCLERRIPDVETLRREIEAWQYKRNQQKAKVDWRFAAIDAREKLQRLYPSITLS